MAPLVRSTVYHTFHRLLVLPAAAQLAVVWVIRRPPVGVHVVATQAYRNPFHILGAGTRARAVIPLEALGVADATVVAFDVAAH